MKVHLFIILFLFLAYTNTAQKIIENPKVGISSRPDVFITNIELTDAATILTVNVKLRVGANNIINKNDYIQISGDTTKLKAVKCLEYEFWESIIVPDENGLTYRIVFPPIDPLVKEINYIDPHPSGWKFFDIELIENSNQSIIPKELLGNWFSTENGKWTFSLLDSLAVFDKKIFNYGSIQKNENIYELIIKNGNIQKTLMCRADNENNYFLCLRGEPYEHYSKLSKVYFKSLEEKQKKPFPAESNIVIYSGIIKKFNPQIGTFVSLIYRNKQNNESFAKVADIEKDGSFSFELSIENPQEVDVRLPTGRENIFLLPGKNMFHLVNSGSKEVPSLYMGESANTTLRHSLIKRMSLNLDVSNRFSELTENEHLNLILSASKSDLERFKELSYKNIRIKNNLFFVPRRAVKMNVELRSTTIASDSFWISNEITNKEYRKFADDIISNPKKIIQWEKMEFSSTSKMFEKKTNVEIYSEIAKSLIDSSLAVDAFFEGNIREINIIEYLNNRKFDNYPVVGIPLKGAEFFCIWMNKKNKIEGNSDFVLPSEITFRILADYMKEIKNYKNKVRIRNVLYEVPKDTIAYLNTNAPEWFSPFILNRMQPAPAKKAILREWENFGDSMNYEIIDDSNLEYSGFRVVRYTRELKESKSNSELIIFILGGIILLLITSLFIWKWRVRQRFRKEAQIRKLRELELTAIRSQMNPHFLFNSLNSVQNLVQQNKGREAHLYLADFAGLIRKVLQNSEKEEVSLAEELEMTEQYLNLEKLRFDFDFKISVNKNIDANNTMVPAILLQPFAENAVIHGLQSKPENRRLIIDILKESTGIKVIIEDNGIGRDAAKKIAKTKNGKGSKMIQERLKILQEKQGEKYSLEIIDLSGEKAGTRVEIFIPEEK
ncbi:MAG: histidine kinase [Prolixibacteraceae bacterium]|jgi:hypothetical protein|nr:histidine kinase [Prolixibacteraceae bacterium]